MHERSPFYRIIIFSPFPSSLQFERISPDGNSSRSSIHIYIYIHIQAIELSFPFTLPFISPRAINPFLLLTRASVTTGLIYFRSRSPAFFLSPPFDVATLDCSVNSASGEHPLSFMCTRLLLPLDWWTAFKSIARISRASYYPAISSPTCNHHNSIDSFFRAKWARRLFCILVQRKYCSRSYLLNTLWKII